MENEKRLIDANALPVSKEYCVDEAGFGANFYVVYKDAIDNAHTVDAVEVVRCKDCRHSDRYKYGRFCECIEQYVEDDFFCADGERKDNV